MLVDSPLDMGQIRSEVGSLARRLGVTSSSTHLPTILKIWTSRPSLLRAYERVPAETFAMYGSRHFADYHALLTLSDAIGFQGIEHHQSSDDRASDDFLTDPDESLSGGDLVTHEFSHSWNGKYRRPADLTTPNFQVPQLTDLLWVYEGMNQYLGTCSRFAPAFASPSSTPSTSPRSTLRWTTRPGATTTPLIDLTTGAPYFYQARGAYPAIRRNANDFYTEGELVWLDVDTIIRERSHGARSLDTFLHRYTAPPVTGPIVETYTRAQIEALLNEVEPYDWHDFFERHVYHADVHPPNDELARAGWRMVYNEKPNEFIKRRASRRSRHWSAGTPTAPT